MGFGLRGWGPEGALGKNQMNPSAELYKNSCAAKNNFFSEQENFFGATQSRRIFWAQNFIVGEALRGNHLCTKKVALLYFSCSGKRCFFFPALGFSEQENFLGTKMVASECLSYDKILRPKISPALGQSRSIVPLLKMSSSLLKIIKI